tara:strand:+ start:130 stop:390 length:261 start_codon:yes stop_codon:yes gene_type:complete
MSNTSHSSKIINFEEKRREFVIRELIKKQIHEPEEIAKLLQMHEFLLYVEDIKIPEENLDKETLGILEEDIKIIREKFDELFEIIK